MRIRLQRVNDFKKNVKAQFLLTQFYGIHLKDKWSLEHRFYELKKWEAMLLNNKSYLIMAVQGKTKRKREEEPLGFALCTPTEKGIIILEGLFVMPEYQGLGVGEKLVKDVWKDGDIHTQAFAESVGFYEKQGFQKVSYREKDDTTEMFTGDYHFEYEYEYLIPRPMPEDAAHIAYLKNIELQA